MPGEELIATQVVPTVNNHLNPFFDMDTFWSIPLWVWIVLAEVIIIGFINFKWLRRKAVMRPVLDYLQALKKGRREDQQSWYFSKNRSFYIEYLQYHDDGIIAYWDLKKISMWFLGSSSAVGHAGGIKSVLISDDYDGVRDPVAELGLIFLIDRWNRDNPDRVIVDYDDYETMRPILEGAYPDGSEIPVYCLYDPSKIQKIFPPNRSAALFGRVNIRDARDLAIDIPEPGWLEKYAFLGASLVISIVSIVITYAFVSGVS